jgi:phage host-nuclease inhibitor protein Gam
LSLDPDSLIFLADLSSPFSDFHRHAFDSLPSGSLFFLVIPPNDHTELKRFVENHKKKISLEQHQLAIADLERQHKNAIEDQASEFQEKLRASEIQATDKITAIQERTAARIRRLQKKLDAQTEKVTAVKEAFETASEELRQRTEDFLNAQIKIRALENELKLVQVELSDAHVDHKMALLKLATSEENLKRERSLAKSQSQTVELSFEAAHEQALADQQTIFDQTLKEVLNRIAQLLKEFILTDLITEEGVIHAIRDVMEELAHVRIKLKEVLEAEAELAAVRSTLGISEDRSVVKTVSQLLAKATWEQWARRMHVLATGNCTIARTNEEIQTGLEEALMVSQRQSGIARKLEMLRFEKKLLIKGKVVPKGLTRRSSLRAVIYCVGTLWKLQKLAGNMTAQ